MGRFSCYRSFLFVSLFNIVMCHLMKGICLEKCNVRQFRCSVNVIECTYTNLDGIAYYNPGCMVQLILLLGYKPVQHSIVLNTRGNCNSSCYDITMSVTSPGNRIFQLHYNFIEPVSYVQSIIDRNIIMQCMTVFLLTYNFHVVKVTNIQCTT